MYIGLVAPLTGDLLYREVAVQGSFYFVNFNEQLAYVLIKSTR